MKHLIFSIYDSKAEAWLQPFFAVNKAVAIRSFASLVNEKNHQFNRFPQDYTLAQIGEFNDETGVLESMSPASVGLGVEFLAQE